MLTFLKIYQSKFPSLSHGLPSFLGSKTALPTNFKSSAAMVTFYQSIELLEILPISDVHE